MFVEQNPEHVKIIQQFSDPLLFKFVFMVGDDIKFIGTDQLKSEALIKVCNSVYDWLLLESLKIQKLNMVTEFYC